MSDAPNNEIPSALVGPGGYPATVPIGGPTEAAWANSVAASFPKYAYMITSGGVAGNILLGGAGAVVSAGVNVDNQVVGAKVLCIGGVSLTSTVAGMAAVVNCGYYPPGTGTTTLFGPAGVVYIPIALGQLSTVAFGQMTMTQIGVYRFFLWATSSTGAISAMSNTGSIAVQSFGA